MICESECITLGAKQNNNLSPYRIIYLNYCKIKLRKWQQQHALLDRDKELAKNFI